MWQLFITVAFLCFSNESSVAAIKIYRSPVSLFHSGNLSLTELLKTKKKIIEEQWVQIRTAESKAWIKREKLILATELAGEIQILNESSYRLRPRLRRPPSGIIPAGEKLKVLESKDGFLSVRWKNKNVWIEEKSAEPTTFENSQVITKQHVQLRARPDSESKSLIQLPLHAKLSPVGNQDGWLKVEFRKRLGWVHLNQVFSLLDFTTDVILGDEMPYLIKAQSGSWLELQDDRFVRLSEIREFRFDSSRAIVKKSIAYAQEQPQIQSPLRSELGFGQKVEVLETENILWAKSETREQGTVWWLLEGVLPPSSQSITQEQMEFHPRLITSTGILFVGPLMSDDGGKSFKPYLRWDLVVSKIIQRFGKAPSRLRLVGLEMLGEKRILAKFKVFNDKKFEFRATIP